MTTPEHRRKCKAYHVRRHQMGGSTTVPADHAREALTELSERMSYSAIGRAIGTSHTYVTSVLRGKVQRISPKREAAILALVDYRPDDTSHVDAEPARRRVRALHAIGYSWVRIAGELDGYSLTSVKHLAHGHTPVIEACHDQLIRAAYERLSMRLPVAANRFEQSAITDARNKSRRYGWVPPLMWNDIDRDAHPANIHQRPSYSRADLLDEWDWLRRTGESMRQAADRLGVTVDAIEKAIERDRRSAA